MNVDALDRTIRFVRGGETARQRRKEVRTEGERVKTLIAHVNEARVYEDLILYRANI